MDPIAEAMRDPAAITITKRPSIPQRDPVMPGGSRDVDIRQYVFAGLKILATRGVVSGIVERRLP